MKTSRLHALAVSFAAIGLVAASIGNSAAQAVSSVVNISTRMVVQTGDNVLIGGFIVSGTGQKNIILRAIGPSLPVGGALADPILELHDASGRLLLSNDNWRTTQSDAIGATGIAPTNDSEAAIVTSLAPGAYTAVVKGVNNASGVALIELYDLDPAGTTSRHQAHSARTAEPLRCAQAALQPPQRQRASRRRAARRRSSGALTEMLDR